MRFDGSAACLLGWMAGIFVAGPAGAVDVTACGQSFEKSGVLTGDLDCTGFPATAVSGSGDFDLAGFTLTGGDGRAFSCTGNRCDVFSSAPGGEIIGAASRLEDCVVETNAGRLTVTGIAIRRCEQAIIGRKVSVNGVTITDSDYGVWMRGFGSGAFDRSRADVIDSDITANLAGLDGDITTFLVENSTITGSSIAGISDTFRGVVKVENSTITGNALGIDATNCTFIDTIIDGNTSGGADCSNRIRMIRGSASSNGGHGLRGGFRMKIAEADLSGNAGSGAFGGFPTSLTEGFAVAVVSVKESTITGNDVDGVGGVRVRIRDSLIDGNGRYGVRASGRDPNNVHVGPKHGSLSVSGSTVTGNGVYGLLADANVGEQPPACLHTVALKLRETTATGNGTDLDCGVGTPCADVGSCVLPKLASDATCDTSHEVGSGVPGTDWEVCALD